MSDVATNGAAVETAPWGAVFPATDPEERWPLKTVVSVDVETVGRVPPEHSMISLGAAAFDLSTGRILSRFSRNLLELPDATRDADTMEWWEKFPEAWEVSRRNPQPPPDVVAAFLKWLGQFEGMRIMASPVAYDGLFLRWYLEAFSPPGADRMAWHNMLDLRSVFWAVTGRYNGNLPKMTLSLTGHDVFSDAPHTALADAIHQGRILVHLMSHARRMRR